MSFFVQPKPQPQPKKEKCVVKTRRTKDGGISRSIEGNCKPEEVKALLAQDSLFNN
jgi:hypothetical protein